MEDHINSNIEPSVPLSVYQELLELEGRRSLSNSSNSIRSTGSRKQYANLDIASMGVNLERGPELDNKIAAMDISDNKMDVSDNKLSESMAEKTAKLHRLLGEADKQRFEVESPESEKLTDSVSEKEEKDIDEAEESLKDDFELSAPVKRRHKREELPPGWEKHQDGEGYYYWHISSGTIQREPPTLNNQEQTNQIIRNIRSSRLFENYDMDTVADPFTASTGIQKSCTTSSICDLVREKKDEKLAENLSKRDNGFSGGGASAVDEKWKRRSLPPGKVQEESGMTRSGSGFKPMQVGVTSLGSCELAEDDLTPENSSRAVNRCIVELSNKESSLQDRTGVWGNGEDLVLELDEGSLKLLEASTGRLVNSQPIHAIRVWGVGRDNGRDFAYVSRDKVSRKHMCHVFRCEVGARTIANALRDICKKILIERSLAQSSSKLTEKLVSTERKERVNCRPTSLAVEGSGSTGKRIVHAVESFPTPMEEPRKTMKAWYLGNIQVSQPSGMDTINAAIKELMETVPQTEWKTAQVSVAPSTVQISFLDGFEPIDCRVRFLSFLGIGNNVQQAAFIMHTTQDTFVCHVFHCEPTAGPLCKTIEAACKLRYQKCLDARPSRPEPTSSERSSIGATIKNMFGALTKKGRSPDLGVT
jgi:amyloid beta (A4) precursor protein-binding family B protein 2 (Fe65-like)